MYTHIHLFIYLYKNDTPSGAVIPTLLRRGLALLFTCHNEYVYTCVYIYI